MAMFVLEILVTFPSWDFIGSGLAEDVMMIITNTNKDIWIEYIQKAIDVEDISFKRIILFVVVHLLKIYPNSIMINEKLMERVLELVTPCFAKSIWKVPGYEDLWETAMYTLGLLTWRIPYDFVKYNGGTKLKSILEWCLSNQFDMRIAKNCTKTICDILMSNNDSMIYHFHRVDMSYVLIELINFILGCEKIVLDRQRIVTLSLVSIEILMEGDEQLKDIHKNDGIEIAMKCLNLYLCSKEQGAFDIDPRLLLAVGSYIWKCIIPNLVHLQIFIDRGAIHVMLDVIEIANHCTSCLFLGILIDICDNVFCGNDLCTWRSKDKKKGVMSLLANIWRDEESRIGIIRNPDGSVENAEFPLMGKQLWMQIYSSKVTYNYSPALIDMIGSVRPKIYALRKIIDRDRETYDIAREHHTILTNDLPIGDQITFVCVDLYFRLKQGQVWIEISQYLNQVGITPTNMDNEVISVMIEKRRSWGMFIVERQKKLRSVAREVEIAQENEIYSKIRNFQFAVSLEALKEMEYVRRTADRSYRSKKSKFNRFKNWYHTSSQKFNTTDNRDSSIRLVSPSSSDSFEEPFPTLRFSNSSVFTDDLLENDICTSKKTPYK